MSAESEHPKQELSPRWWAIGSEEDRIYWETKYEKATSFMASCNSISSILIEVAAQHPLDDGLHPNDEFRGRLLLAQKLYLQETKVGNHVEIYVPGSIHVFEGKSDKVSLSQAGREFLIQQGLPPHLILGDDLNKRYKGDDGVYNSADECFVAANYFRDNNFGSLYSVISPAQVFRKTLHYLEFGILPMNFTVPSRAMFHNYIGEIFEAIPYVLFVDHSLQEHTSIRAKELRQIRKPTSV